MAQNETGTYRHRVTGLVEEIDLRTASVFADVLDEVNPGTKPLAYLPLPDEAIAAYRLEHPSEPSFDAIISDESEVK